MKKIFIVLLLFFFSLEFVKGQTSKLGYEVSDSAGVLELVKWERKDSIVDLTKDEKLNAALYLIITLKQFYFPKG
jgi:hypothetical protein